MKKYILLLIVTLFFSCQNQWSKQDKNLFILECKQKGEGTEKECNCMLSILMGEFSSYEEAKNTMKYAEGEEREELNKIRDLILEKCVY